LKINLVKEKSEFILKGKQFYQQIVFQNISYVHCLIKFIMWKLSIWIKNLIIAYEMTIDINTTFGFKVIVMLCIENLIYNRIELTFQNQV